jgi:hypothetical protein
MLLKTKKNTPFILYKKIFSPDGGMLQFFYKQTTPVCVFYPSCSEYCEEVVQKYGLIIGLYKSFLRIVRCHPWQKNHIDLP